jgi:hypothetical protein
LGRLAGAVRMNLNVLLVFAAALIGVLLIWLL